MIYRLYLDGERTDITFTSLRQAEIFASNYPPDTRTEIQEEEEPA